MDFTPNIERRLLQIHRQRSRLSFLPVLAIIIASTYFQRDELTRYWTWWVPITLVAVSILIRIINMEYFTDAWLSSSKISKCLNPFSMFLQGLGWGLHFCMVYEAYGNGSPNVSYVLLAVAGMIAGATTSLNASPISYFTFVTTISVTAAAPYLANFGGDTQFGLFGLIIFYIYNVSNFRISHRELKKSVETELTSIYERNRFRRLVDAVPGFVVILDKDLFYLEANSNCLILDPKLIGKNVKDLYVDFHQQLIEFQQTNKESDIFERSFFYEGVESWYLMSVRKTEDQGLVIISLPMDELMNAKKELRIQEARSMYSSKLAALGEMAAGIAHEINNPLTIIKGSADIIERLVNETPMDVDTVQVLSQRLILTSERIAKIIKSMKSLSRSGENDPFQPVKVSTLILQCMDICRQRLNQFDIDLILPEFNDSNDVTISCREVQIGQVIINLVNNSIDAVKDHNTRKIVFEVKVNSKWVEIFVRDSGPGIPSEVQARMMEPFFTTKELNHGTGLGLSISRSILSEHGGELSFLPKEPMTTFLMSLPKNR